MSQTKPQSVRSWRGPIWLALTLLAGGGLAATLFFHPPARTKSANHDILAIVVSGDTAGWIVPCGCTSNQSGGLLRRGTFVRRLREQADVIVTDAGGAAAGTSRYQRVKFEAILQGELAMGLAAHNLGASEAALGADYLHDVAAKYHVPFVSANVTDVQGKPIAEPLRVVELGGLRVALAGVLSQRSATNGVQIEEPRSALLRTIANAKGKFDSLVVLAYMTEEEMVQLASSLPEADAILGGPTGQSVPARQVGPTLIASATNKGKFLVQLSLQKSARGRSRTGTTVEMQDKYADDADQEANVRRYLAELAKLDLSAAETGFVTSLAMPKDYHLAGNATCIACHKNDCTLWDGSKHGHAWQTIKDKGYHVDGYCQQCHTTGFGLPGGFESIGRSSSLTNVGCESCHGPSHAHVQNVKTKTPFTAKDQCVRCHDHENSPKFEYESYWPKIKHGDAK